MRPRGALVNSRRNGEALKLVLLPTYPRYPVAEIGRNIEVLDEFFRHNEE